MKLGNYKNIKKSEWQGIASQFGIEWDENSVVRYLVEKIAEKVGVDDKIVSDNELKRQVVDKINATESNIKEEVVKEPVIAKVKSVKSEKKAGKKTTKSETNKTKSKSEDVAVENSDVVEVPLSRIEQLRLECESYGIAWSEKHSEQNLEQVLNGVKNAGVQPIKEVVIPATKVVSKSELNTNDSFEITSENANEVATAVANNPMNLNFNNPNQPAKPVVNGGYTSSNAYLETYRNIYTNAIRGHFRLLTINEIHEIINRDTQSFTYEIKQNPNQLNQIEILLKQGSDIVRVPSNDLNDWLNING